MKYSCYTILFVLLSTFKVWGQSVLDTPISLKAKEISLVEAIDLLTQQEKIQFAYATNLLPETKVSFNFKQKPLAQVLYTLFKHTDIFFQEEGGLIVLFHRKYKQNYIPKEFTISGYLYDLQSGERLIGASIWDEGSGKGTFSNAYGFFSLTLPEGTNLITFSYLGFQQELREFNLHKDETVWIGLETRVFLDTMEITATQIFSKEWLNERSNIQNINIADVNALPSFGGEADIMRFLHTQPGVQTGADGIGGLFVRGGNPGHNLILIDDVPVYNLSHGAGLLSIINTDAVRSAEFIKGGFSAKYGGRLSSVLDIRTKEGNLNSFHAKAEVSALTAKVFAEGPIIPGKASFFVSGRQSIADWFLGPISSTIKSNRNEQGSTGYNFNDLSLKLNYVIDSFNQVYLSVYKNRDDFDNFGSRTDRFTVRNSLSDDLVPFRYDQKYEESIGWGNTVAALRWNHIFSPRLFANTTITYSKLWVDIAYDRRDSLSIAGPGDMIAKSYNISRYSSSIEDIGAKIDLELTHNSSFKTLFGLSVNSHLFAPGALQLNESTDELQEDDIFSEPQLRSTEYVGYVENQFDFGKKLFIDVGLRATILGVPARNYRVLQPRLALQWQISPKLRFSSSHGKTYQFLHLLSSSGFGLPTDLWVTSTRNIPPQEAWQSVVGLDIDLAKNWGLKIEGYYKRMENLITYSEGAFFFIDWQKNITRGNGMSRGIEIQLQKRWGQLNGWISYTLSETNRQFDNVNLGNPYPFNYDRTHNLSLSFVHKLSKSISLSGNYTIGTGLAFSLPLQKYEFQYENFPAQPITALIYNGKNQYRLPTYHRFDIGLNASFKTNFLQHNLKLGVYNIYNRNNPLYYDLRTSLIADGERLNEVKEFVQVWLIPFFPSFSYAISF